MTHLPNPTCLDSPQYKTSFANPHVPLIRLTHRNDFIKLTWSQTSPAIFTFQTPADLPSKTAVSPRVFINSSTQPTFATHLSNFTLPSICQSHLIGLHQPASSPWRRSTWWVSQWWWYSLRPTNGPLRLVKRVICCGWNGRPLMPPNYVTKQHLLLVYWSVSLLAGILWRNQLPSGSPTTDGPLEQQPLAKRWVPICPHFNLQIIRCWESFNIYGTVLNKGVMPVT